ncbi:MAG: hypothetical protein QOJ73_6446 [Streptosporangiaceae bacterium]|jgi:hypothetical protein|nr:hypothetical protein [Streptosporangiaceae bacterium]
MSIPFPEPTAPVPPRAEVFLTYLDYFRYARHVGHLDIVSELADGETGQ